MKLNLLDRIGDLNPQMWREIKGRFKPRNLVIAAIISLLGQFMIAMANWQLAYLVGAGFVEDLTVSSPRYWLNPPLQIICIN